MTNLRKDIATYYKGLVSLNKNNSLKKCKWYLKSFGQTSPEEAFRWRSAPKAD